MKKLLMLAMAVGIATLAGGCWNTGHNSEKDLWRIPGYVNKYQ